MPVAYVDIPSGLTSTAKAQLTKELAEILHEALPIPDTRIYLREFTAENTSLDGVPGAPFRVICDYVVPPALSLEGKRKLIAGFNSAINRAMDLREDVVTLPSGKRVTTRWVLHWIREVPLDLAAFDNLMAFENPMVMEFVPKH
jgi:phenylpyruvate tautomerase PptA (4-oxalocrotonate tautomerase family)